MFQRQRTGSVVCPSCGKLVGVNDSKCLSCGRLVPGMWGFGPLLRRFGQDMGFVPVIMGLCGILYGLSLVSDPQGIRMGGLLSFLSPSGPALLTLGASGPAPVLIAGRWWTLLSAGYLHGGLLHIGFNLYWLNQFAPAVATLYGPGRMVIIYTVGSVVGFLFSSLAILVLQVPGLHLLGWVLGGGAGLTVGASAALFGLLGAMVHYGRRVSSAIGRQALMYAGFFFIFGLVMSGVDNWAHLGGFVGGYGASLVMNPLKPERGDHLFWALLCLVAAVAAVVASWLVPW